MAGDQIEIRLPKTRVTERSAFTALAYFRTRSTKTSATPTNARYRIDDLESKQTIRDWTSLTPSTSNSISITASDNQIKQGSKKTETRQITVQMDAGLDTQVTQTAFWKISNIYGIT